MRLYWSTLCFKNIMLIFDKILLSFFSSDFYLIHSVFEFFVWENLRRSFDKGSVLTVPHCCEEKHNISKIPGFAFDAVPPPVKFRSAAPEFYCIASHLTKRVFMKNDVIVY